MPRNLSIAFPRVAATQSHSHGEGVAGLGFSRRPGTTPCAPTRVVPSLCRVEPKYLAALLKVDENK